jgi:hypothetical protein
MTTRKGHRRPRKKQTFRTSSIERSVEGASSNSIVSASLPVIASAIAVPILSGIVEKKGWLNTTIKDADYRRYFYGLASFGLGFVFRKDYPLISLGLMVGGPTYAFLPNAKKAADDAMAQMDAPPAPPQLPGGAPATP